MTDPFLVLLDRDGTIIVDKHYLADPDGVELLPGAVEGLQQLKSAGAIFCVVTNQSGVARGYFDLETVDRIHQRLQDVLAESEIRIEHYAVCPHHPDAACECRKPAPRLALECAALTGLDLASAWVVGDKASDVGLADAVGAQGLRVGTKDLPDLGAVADRILASRG